MKEQQQPRMFMWSAPRTLSTAFFRAMEHRRKIKVFYQPYSHSYYFGAEKLTDYCDDYNYVPDDDVLSMDSALKSLMIVPDDCPVFAKEQAYYILCRDNPMQYIPAGYESVFLFRDPRKSFVSGFRVWKDTSTMEKLGHFFENGSFSMKNVWDLYQMMKSQNPDRKLLVIDADDFAKEPAHCVYPFQKVYTIYNTCTYDVAGFLWCSSDPWFQGNWEKCPDKPCHFPFKYKGEIHHNCTNEDSPDMPWCSSSEEYDGFRIPCQTKSVSANCSDNFNNCTIVATEGECFNNNTSFVMDNCRKSCNQCHNRTETCSYPFKFGNLFYDTCTRDGHSEMWCSPDSTFRGRRITCPEKPCHFPFKYKGVLYEECTLEDSSVSWCATSEEYDGFRQPCHETECVYPLTFGLHNYHTCMKGDLDLLWCTREKSATAQTLVVCPNECKFPFEYQGKMYHECISEHSDIPWCHGNDKYRGFRIPCNKDS